MMPEFQVHRLNAEGDLVVRQIGAVLSRTLQEIENIVSPREVGHREMALARTKLQEAAHWAQRAVSLKAEYQQQTDDEGQNEHKQAE